MKKMRRLLIALIILISANLVYVLTFSKIAEHTYNKVMCYYVSRVLTAKADNFNQKVIVIRNFVHENVHPVSGYDNRLDTEAIEKLISGVGWCDQQSRTFMQLAGGIGITSRLLFLQLSAGGSPHSVVEVLAPDNRWVIVDTAYNLDLVNKNGDFASQSDIKQDMNIMRDNEKVRLRSEFEKRWADDEYLSIYANPPSYIITKKGLKHDPLKYVPLSWLRPIINIMQNRYLSQIRDNITDKFEFKLMKARDYHLLGYYGRAWKLYEEVIRHSDNPKVTRKAEFYYALLLKDKGEAERAVNYISDIIDNTKNSPYTKYLYSLRASIYKKIGKIEEFKSDLKKIQYDLDA